MIRMCWPELQANVKNTLNMHNSFIVTKIYLLVEYFIVLYDTEILKDRCVESSLLCLISGIAVK